METCYKQRPYKCMYSKQQLRCFLQILILYTDHTIKESIPQQNIIRYMLFLLIVAGNKEHEDNICSQT